MVYILVDQVRRYSNDLKDEIGVGVTPFPLTLLLDTAAYAADSSSILSYSAGVR